MSDLLLPQLRGLQYPIGKTPNWHTIKNRTATGLPTYLQMYSFPWYTFKLSFSYLEDADSEADDIHTLLGFFNRVGGAGQSFLFADSNFENNSVSSQSFGIGDGTSTTFQLTRVYGEFPEPIYGLLMTPVITSTVNGTETMLTVNTNFTWDTNGTIHFVTAPVSGAILKWTGEWYYRVHFKDDTAEFQQLFYRGWGLESIELESVKLQ